MRVLLILTVSLLFVASPSLVKGTGIPSPELSTVSWNAGAAPSATLLVLPDGTGPAFAAARTADGQVVDATVSLVLRDYQGMLIAAFPAEDLWIESGDGGLVFCIWGNRADSFTDAQGRTSWALPRRAGGHSEAPCHVFVNAQRVTGGIEPALHFNSPDLDGDLDVDLADVSAFAASYFGAYAPGADLHFDGAVNISDITVLARAIGVSCR